MSETTASRTLVKSPPELWAECSDASALTRHLDQFGEIKITKLEPETAVAWEGERVSGTVRIESSGWGTRVTLTARAEVEPEVAVEAPVVAVEPAPTVAVEPDPPAAPAPVAPAARSGGMFARLLERLGFRAAPTPAPVLALTLAPEPEQEPEPAAVEPEPAPAAVEPEPTPAQPPVAAELAEIETALTAALDSLGQAHHRPFSRS